MSKAVEYNATAVQSIVRVLDTVTNTPYTGLTPGANPNMKFWYRQDFFAPVEIPIVSISAPEANWAAGVMAEIGQGYYSIDVPDAAWVQTAPTVTTDELVIRAVMVWLEDLTNSAFFPLSAYHPLQRVIEAVAFTTDGGLYAVNTDLYGIFGRRPVYKWANQEGLAVDAVGYETAIQAAITNAITFATADVNDKLRGGPYTIPFTDASLTAMITYATALKAGVMLYEWRGADDYNYENGKLTHRYTFLADRADKILEQIRRAARILDSEIAEVGGSRAPGIPEVS